MRLLYTAAAAFLGTARAFPGMTSESIAANHARDAEYETILVGRHEVPKVARDVPFGPVISSIETNCGFGGPCQGFNAAQQYVSTTGIHAYQAPGTSDLRGPCPGLNAAANHAYLPRSGITSVPQTVTGLFAAYGMGPGLATVLSTYAIVFEGDLTTLSWSIGGPPPATLQTGGLLGRPTGISYSHNNYEGDSSATRADAYMNNGDAHSLHVDRFAKGYTYTQNGGYTMDSFRQLFAFWQQYSESNNPYYAAPPFSTTLVTPAAYNFVINFMSNHSDSQKSGFLSPQNYMTFFAVSGTYPNFQWNEGQERIPDNFYRRPDLRPYSNGDVIGDIVKGYLAYPQTFRLGGNTNGVNTFAGVDLANLTGGVYNFKNLIDPKNLACFLDSFTLQFIPYFLKPSSTQLAAATALLNKQGRFATGFSCPALGQMDLTVFDKYPGFKYMPKPPGF